MLETLRTLGLTESETQSFVTIVTEGAMTAGTLAKKTKLNRSNLYDTLERLTQKGLIYSQVRNKRKVFIANDPEKLHELLAVRYLELDEHKKELQGVVTHLKSVHRQDENTLRVDVYQGAEGVKFVLRDLLLLRRGEVIYGYGNESMFQKVFKYSFPSFIRARSRKGIMFKGVFKVHKGARQSRTPKTEVKYVDFRDITPTETLVYKDTVLIMTGDDTFVRMSSPQIANSHKIYFDYLWKNGFYADRKE